jgi:hypothetical protein
MFEGLLERLAQALESCSIAYMVIGGQVDSDVLLESEDHIRTVRISHKQPPAPKTCSRLSFACLCVPLKGTRRAHPSRAPVERVLKRRY